MKVTDSEVQELIKELDRENSGRVNYQEFLKFSYLCQMFLQHLNLEHLLFSLDEGNKGLITVGQLDEIL